MVMEIKAQASQMVHNLTTTINKKAENIPGGFMNRMAKASLINILPAVGALCYLRGMNPARDLIITVVGGIAAGIFLAGDKYVSHVKENAAKEREIAAKPIVLQEIKRDFTKLLILEGKRVNPEWSDLKDEEIVEIAKANIKFMYGKDFDTMIEGWYEHRVLVKKIASECDSDTAEKATHIYFSGLHQQVRRIVSLEKYLQNALKQIQELRNIKV